MTDISYIENTLRQYLSDDDFNTMSSIVNSCIDTNSNIEQQIAYSGNTAIMNAYSLVSDELDSLLGNWLGRMSGGVQFPLTLNPVLYIPDLVTPVDGYWQNRQGKLVQAATTTILNDSLIMPANDSQIINALTLAGCYSTFYTDNSTPKKVLKSSILQNYGDVLFFDEFNKKNMLLYYSVQTTYKSAILNYIKYVDWLFPTGVINFTQIIDFSKIFGKLEK